MNKIIPVRYKGANYMCIEGSDRARFLSQANALWAAGDASERDVFSLALASSGCAFGAREFATADMVYAAETLRGDTNG